MPDESTRHGFAATIWWPHGSNYLHFNQLHREELFVVIPNLVIKQLSEELNCRLRFHSILVRHVDVINKNNKFLAQRRAIYTLPPFVKFAHNDVLSGSWTGIAIKGKLRVLKMT